MKETGPRILMVLSYFHPYKGGAENQALLLSEALRRSDLDVAVLTRSFSHLPASEIIGAIPVHRHIKTVDIRTLFGARYFCTCLMSMLARRKHYDILHCHILQGFHSAAAVISGRLFNKKVVIKIANTGVPSDFLHIKRLIGGRLLLRLLKKADAVVATSRLSVQEALAEGFTKHHIAFIPNGVDCERFRPAPGHAACARDRIVCVGRLVPTKGIDILLDAFHQLKRDGLGRRLDIVGAGPEHGHLAQKAANLGCAGDVTFHGEVGDVERFFDTTCIFVQPSLAEGMSNVLLEAMAAGLPVIATRTGAAPDIIQDGVNGLLIDTGSADQICAAVNKIISDEAFAVRLGRAARATVEKSYSIDIVAAQYMDLYQRLMSTRRAP